MQGGVGREEELNNGLVCPALEVCWAQDFQTDPKPRSCFLSEPWCYGLQPARLLCPWDLLGKNTGVDRLFHLYEIFPTQDSIPLRYLGNPIFTLFVGKPRSYETSRQRAVPTSCQGKWHSVLRVWCVPQACPLALLGLFVLGFGCVDNQC